MHNMRSYLILFFGGVYLESSIFRWNSEIESVEQNNECPKRIIAHVREMLLSVSKIHEPHHWLSRATFLILLFPIDLGPGSPEGVYELEDLPPPKQ